MNITTLTNSISTSSFSPNNTNGSSTETVNSDIKTTTSSHPVSSLTMLNDTLHNIRTTNQALKKELSQKTLTKTSLEEIALHSSQISMDVNKSAQLLNILSKTEYPINKDARELLHSAPKEAELDGYEMISHRELWAKIANSINDINEQYLKVYEHAVSSYTQMYQEFSAVLSSLAGWISPGGNDGNSVKLQVKSLKDALTTLKKNYEDKPLYPATNTVSEQEANKWLTELGGTIGTVSAKNGGYVVSINMTPINNMLNSLDKLGTTDEVVLDNAKYQAWNAGFSAEDETMKNNLQTLVQKYSNANSIFDNLVKVLSSTISSCTDTDKLFLHF
ncbi:TPA: type III secretion system needle tip complex protein IpaD [Shigella dysenteriae]|uniref:type III secretion system needle tip complex protein IpaD n=1 Tax=Shigella TaxID=620 RepID=UPI000CF644FC|nr:type III secretion system needle tip complex protein IpaD [Shigella dysenteriae]EFP7225387.1 type III secretion system needle tip complex protein IpaD [Shigella dysenteriae]EFP7618563.1 type III secretion system needle tip complex protein IpaD [Shigella dysenteriae]EFW8404706.1 type III secretion system needle tip complex protein IpaD [Shigella dysenteriae]EFX6526919.1 type III secretion system needle tip complex protein IpaD [Shigella dysenteriae]EFX9648835.1 type III secretion system need